MIGRVLPVLAALAFAACAGQQSQQAPVPALLRYKSPDHGGPTFFPEASPSGRLDLAGECVKLDLGDGRSRIIISSHRAGAGRDARGPYLEYGGRRFRHWQLVKGGGGVVDHLPAELLDAPVPAACRTGPFLIFVSVEGFDPAKVPPPESPPPPGPVLIRYKPPGAGGPEAFRAALLTGELDLSGPCVRLIGPSGDSRVVVTSAGSRLGFDELGVFLPSGSDRLRHGDEVRAGGGDIGPRLIVREIDGQVPTGCAGGPFVEAIGIHRRP